MIHQPGKPATWRSWAAAARSGHRPVRRLPSFALALENLEARLTPDVTLTVSDPAPFPKPDSGQTLGMFVVTRSGDLDPPVQVDYATQDGTGPDGARAGIDYVATAGTLTFAPEQTTATVAVSILGNNVFQPDKTFTLRLSNPLPDAVDFAPPQTFGARPGDASAVVADFNGDGTPDLALLRDSPFAVVVWLNTTPPGATSPSFGPPVTFAVGPPISLAVGDFNGDGKPDLAVGEFSVVSILRNTTPAGATTPSFALPQTFAINGAAASVVVGDFNGDGKPDLATANGNTNTVSVLLNTTPTGAPFISFAPQQTFASGGTNPSALAVADFTGDGKPDLAVVNNRYPTQNLAVLVNTTPTGGTVASFGAEETFPLAVNPLAVAVADFNGDGKPDLVVTEHNAGIISVLMNTTPTGATIPSFTDQQTFTQVPYPTAVAVGDFTGDGKPDLAVTIDGFPGLGVLLNTTPAGASVASFGPPQLFVPSSGVGDLAVGDFNGDGKPDLVGRVGVLFNTTPTVTVSGSPATGTILEDDAPEAIATVAGSTPQAATVAMPFAVPLAVNVRNAAGDLVQGVQVTFTAPASGPGGSFGGRTAVTVVTDPNGRAVAPPFTADTLAGSYQVSAQVAGGSDPATTFDLTNQPGLPAVVAALAGAGQSATVATAFAAPLLAQVTDQYGNPVSGVLVVFQGPDSGAGASFVGGATALTDANGQVSKAFTANTVAGSYTLTALAAGGSNPVATYPDLSNTPAAASHLSLTGLPSSVVAGTAFGLTVTALDVYNNVASGYTGTVTFSSTDPNASLPADYPFTAADAGVHSFSGVTLTTAGSRFLIATDTTDPSLNGLAVVVVTPAAADHIAITVPAEVPEGVPFPAALTVQDVYNNIATAYTGTVHVSTNLNEMADYTFTAADQGTHAFTVQLATPGSRTVTAADTADPSISGSASFVVLPGTADPRGLGALARAVPVLDIGGTVPAAASDRPGGTAGPASPSPVVSAQSDPEPAPDGVLPTAAGAAPLGVAVRPPDVLRVGTPEVSTSGWLRDPLGDG